MTKTILLLGRQGTVVESVRQQLERADVDLLGGTTLEDVQRLFKQQPIDIVILGAGLALEARLEIVEAIFTVSQATTVHMKDWQSGPTGMVPFVNGILRGLVS